MGFSHPENRRSRMRGMRWWRKSVSLKAVAEKSYPPNGVDASSDQSGQSWSGQTYTSVPPLGFSIVEFNAVVCPYAPTKDAGCSWILTHTGYTWENYPTATRELNSIRDHYMVHCMMWLTGRWYIWCMDGNFLIDIGRHGWIQITKQRLVHARQYVDTCECTNRLE